MPKYPLFDPRFEERVKSAYANLDCRDNFFKFISAVRDAIWYRLTLPKISSYVPADAVTFEFKSGAEEEISIHIGDIRDENVFKNDYYEFELVVDPYDQRAFIFVIKGIQCDNITTADISLEDRLYESVDNMCVRGRHIEIIGSHLDWFFSRMLHDSVGGTIVPIVDKHQDHIVAPPNVTDKRKFAIRQFTTQGVMEIFVDDIRQPKAFPEIGVRTVESAIEFIKLRCQMANKDYVLSLDHDMGDMAAHGGDCIEILNWLEKEILYPSEDAAYKIIMPKEIFYHTSNPVGRANMQRIEQSIRRKIQEANK